MAPEADFVRAIYFYVGVFLPASVILPLSIGAYKRVYAQPSLRIIFVYLIVAGVTNVLTSIIGAAHQNNLPLLHIYTIVELVLLLWYYAKILTEKPASRLIRRVGLVFSVAAVLNFLLLQSAYAFNAYPRAIASIIITLLSGYYFLTEHNPGPEPQPHKWINFGLLQYFGSAIFMFTFSNVLYEHASKQGQYIIGALHATLVLIMYGLMTVGFMASEKSG